MIFFILALISSISIILLLCTPIGAYLIDKEIDNYILVFLTIAFVLFFSIGITITDNKKENTMLNEIAEEIYEIKKSINKLEQKLVLISRKHDAELYEKDKTILELQSKIHELSITKIYEPYIPPYSPPTPYISRTTETPHISETTTTTK